MTHLDPTLDPTGADFLQLESRQAPAGRLTAWLADQLRSAIGEGRLPLGSRLPATRVLAADLGVSRGVVVAAYQRLVDEGRLVGRQGGGTTVASPPPTPVPLRAPAPGAPAPSQLNLYPGVPDLSAFPRERWLRAERRVLDQADAVVLGYGDLRGARPLRIALADWLGRSRGIRADPDDLMIVTGTAQAMALVAQVLGRRGRHRLAIEDPSSGGSRNHLQYWGARTPPIPVDEHGLNVARLSAIDADAVFVTPAHQFPTGVVLAPHRRRELIDWARATGGLIVEDDYDAEHRYDRAPVAALQSLAPEHVIYLGSVSKSLAPALRLGWLLAPERWRDDFVEAKRGNDLGSPTLPQLVLAELISSGDLERHLRLVRGRQRRRRDAMVEEINRLIPGLRLHGVAAGLHVLVTMTDGIDDREVARKAAEAGLRVQPLSEHLQLGGPPGLVLGYAMHSPDQLRHAVQRLSAVLTGPAH